MSDVDGLRALAESATPGPWTAMYGGVVHSLREAFQEAVIYNVPCACGEDVNHVGSQDAAYIAAASPDVVLGLLDRVADLEGQLGRTEDQIQERGGFINQTVDQQERLDRVAAVAREWTALGSATVYETAAEMGRVIRDALDGPESDAGVEVALGSSDGALGAQKGGKP